MDVTSRDVNADGFKETLVDTLNATCRYGDGMGDRIWTCFDGEVASSISGPSPAGVDAFHLVT